MCITSVFQMNELEELILNGREAITKVDEFFWESLERLEGDNDNYQARRAKDGDIVIKHLPTNLVFYIRIYLV